MIVTYLLPIVWAGKVPIEYMIVEKKRDMRTRFCKNEDVYMLFDIARMLQAKSAGVI